MSNEIDDVLKADIMRNLRWAIHHGQLPWKKGQTKFGAVMDLLRFGSTTSKQICEWADCDPYEIKRDMRTGGVDK